MIEQALVFITAAVVFVPISKKLGLGSVLGYLIAGIVVGPQGIGFITDSESVLHFAELGVVLLLFVIGLEIQPRKLWSMRVGLLGLGGLQILVTSLLFFAIGLGFGLSMVVSAVVAISLSLSSTAFALQTLIETNRLNTTFGQSAFSILLMQDIVAIPALAIVPVLGAKAMSGGLDLKGALLVVWAILGMVIGSRYLIRPLFRFIASSKSRDIFTAATLLIVLGVAALMQQVGLSAALGTFIAGVLLADSEYRHELESDLEPFKSLLMGLFFMAVGMSISLELIMEKPFLILGIALLYISLKFIIIYLVARLFRLNHENAKMTGLMISQGGEFAFVLLTLALRSELLQQELVLTLAAIITVSMAMSPLLLLGHQLWQLRWAQAKPAFDEIKSEVPDVIIAGFGRVGQIFGRILRAQGIPFVAIDHDATQVELVRRFGNKVYYGDASRRELLEAAGAAKAKFFILAVDDMEGSLSVAEEVKSHFPNLTILARARNRGHAFDLRDLGIEVVKRETLESSLLMVEELLMRLGFSKAKASSLITRFREHDELMLEEQYKHRSDDQMFISVSKQGAAQLEEVLKQDDLQTYTKG